MEILLKTKLRSSNISEISLETIRNLSKGNGIILKEFNTNNLKWRDPEITIAMISLASTALGALIAGLFKIVNVVKANKIVIQAKNGRRIEIPIGCDQSEIENYIEMAKSLDVDTLKFE